MAKKTKSQVRGSKSIISGESGEIRQIAEIQSQLRGGERAFNPDYSEVMRDLKRIAVLAVFFIGVLILLSFFLG